MFIFTNQNSYLYVEEPEHNKSFKVYQSSSKERAAKMGSSNSSEEKFEEKIVDSNGQVNNNIVIQEAKDTHNQVLINEKMLMAAYALIAFEVIKLFIYLYTQYCAKMKKKYSKNPTDA